MATIVEFALKEEPLDVEKMRKCLLKQVIGNNRSTIYCDLIENKRDNKDVYDLFSISLYVTCFIVAGESGGETRGHRHHAEVGLQMLPAAVCAVRDALRLAKGHTRRDQHWVSEPF